MENYKFKVDNDINCRLDKYITLLLPDISRTRISQLIKDGNIKVNGKLEKNSYKVLLDDYIEISIPDDKNIDILPENIPLNIVYEDSDVIIVNKPTGMIVHPSSGIYTNTLVNALLYHCKDLSGINGVERPGIVHRIDKDTSGLLMVAKNDKAHKSLSKQLEEHSVNRKYIALVHGVINHEYGTIDAPIGRSIKDRKKMCCTDKNAKNAITHFKVLERYKDYTLVECRLETGRTHQIRVHMAYINHPVYGDPTYGLKKDDNTYGQYLHAKVLGFIHPSTGEEMYFESELPTFFENKLRELRGEENE